VRELSVAEQRYQAVLVVIEDGFTVTDVAGKVGVSRQPLHAWLDRYARHGLEGLADRSHRPQSCGVCQGSWTDRRIVDQAAAAAVRCSVCAWIGVR
jgi:transposase-like protein